MFEQKEKDTASGNSKRSRKLRQYLLCGVAAAALIAAAAAVYNASADTPAAPGKNEAPGTLTPNQNAVGLPDFHTARQARQTGRGFRAREASGFGAAYAG